MYRRVLSIAALATLTIGGGLFAPANGRSPAIGPHDAQHTEIDLEEIWLPRHGEEIARRGLAPNMVNRVESRARAFSNPTRVSRDLLAAPGPDQPLAQAETQTEPYLAVNPANPNHLVAGWQEHRFSDGGARALGFAVSMNGGKRWTEGRIPGLTKVDGGPWDRASDPWVAFGPDDVVYFNSLLVTDTPFGDPNAIAVSRSDDGGFTWNDPVDVFRAETDFNDKNSMVVDNSQSKYRGNVYVGWDINGFTPGGFSGQRLVVARSTDGGRSFEAPRRIHLSQVNLGIIIRVGTDGTAYAMWTSAEAADPNLSILFSKSSNGGRRWSRPSKIADLLAVGVAGSRSGVILPSFDIDPTTDALYVAWADARFTGVDQAALSVSTDGGATWSAPTQVSDPDDGEPVRTVGVAAKADGGVMVGYYSEERNLQTGYTVSLSSDAGTSFAAPVRVDRKSFCDCAAATASGGRFLGDYIGLAGGGDDFFVLFTAAHKKSRIKNGHQPDIFAARSR